MLQFDQQLPKEAILYRPPIFSLFSLFFDIFLWTAFQSISVLYTNINPSCNSRKLCHEFSFCICICLRSLDLCRPTYLSSDILPTMDNIFLSSYHFHRYKVVFRIFRHFSTSKNIEKSRNLPIYWKKVKNLTPSSYHHIMLLTVIPKLWKSSFVISVRL
jgi:hypothetical protein